MWTLKSSTTKRWTQEELNQYNQANPRNPLPVGRLLQLQLSMTFTDGPNDISVDTWVNTADEVKAAIKQNLDRLNEQEVIAEKVAANTILDEEPEPEKTPEEIAAEAQAQAKAVWQQKRAALKQMREDMIEAQDLGVQPTPEQTATMKALAEWVRDNATEEFYT